MFKPVGKTRVRTVGLWLLLALLLSACQPIQQLPATQTASAASAETSTEAASKAVVQRLYEEVLNQKQLNVADEIFDANVIDHNGGPNGGEAAKAGVAVVLTGLPDLQVTADLWIIKGDLVTSRVTFTGTQTGELMGVAPTGKPVTWTHIDIHRVQNGKITDIWHNIPVADILHQIQGDPTAQTDTGQTEMEAANQAVIQRFYDEVINQRHFDLFPEIFADKVSDHDLGPTFSDIMILFNGIPNLHVTVERWIVKGDTVTSVVSFTGTQDGEMMGVAPTHNKVTWTHVDVHRIKDGRIAEYWHNIPYSDILQQIGYTLVPPAPVKITSDTTIPAQETPFTGTVEAQETYIITAPTMLVDTTGSGEATELGQFTVTWEFTVNLDTGAGVGSAHFIAANGDSLDTTSLGQGDPTGKPDENRVVEQHTITGGTGRFAGATGSFTLERLVSTATGVTSGSFEGSIVLQKAK